MKQIWQVLLSVACVSLIGQARVFADTCVTNPQGGPQICARWDGGGDPPHPSAFEVTFTDASFPDVQLKFGDFGWRLWSLQGSNIGDIGVISSPVAQNFGVSIQDASGFPGARHCLGINLDPTGTSNHSVIGGRITGNLNGNLLVEQSSGGTGGVAGIAVDGTATGTLTIPVITGLAIGDLTGNIVGQKLNGGLTINRSMDSAASISIDDWVSGEIQLGVLGSPGVYTIAGPITLFSGIELGQAVNIHGKLTGLVDLNDQPLSGTLNLYGGGGGSLTGVSAFSGTLRLGFGIAKFSGTATLANVASSGAIETGQCAALNGTVQINGAMPGSIIVGGALETNGKIHVGGDITGTVVVNDCKGATPTTGEIIAVGNITETANLTIYGLFDGDICASNLVPPSCLPPNISLTFGPNGTICGAILIPAVATVTGSGYGPCTTDAQCNPADTGATEGDCLGGKCHTPLNRYLEFVPPAVPSGASGIALRVILETMPGPDPLFVCSITGAPCIPGPTAQGNCPAGNTCPAPNCPQMPDYHDAEGDVLWVGNPNALGVSNLKTAPVFRSTWTRCSNTRAACTGGPGQGTCPSGQTCSISLVTVTDCDIVPCATYRIQAVSNACETSTNENRLGTPLTLKTANRPGNISGINANLLTPADGNVGATFTDIGLLLERFKGLATVPSSERPRCDLSGNVPTHGSGPSNNIDFQDVSMALDGFKNIPYDLIIGPSNGPGSCNHIVCGDGVLQAGEQCDDGNIVNGDGCQGNCQLP